MCYQPVNSVRSMLTSHWCEKGLSVSYHGRSRRSDPVNCAEACVRCCPAFCCENIPDSSHAAAVTAGGGKRSNLGPQIGANDLPLVNSGAFCVKCNWPTSNKKDFLCGMGLKSTAYPHFVSNNMAGCPDPGKSPLWLSFTQTCLLSHSVSARPGE